MIPVLQTKKAVKVVEMEVQNAQGHLCTIQAQNCVEPVVGLTYLPLLQCICTAHFMSKRIWFYSTEGQVLGSFAFATMQNPSGMAALNTRKETIVVSDYYGKCLHLLSLDQRPEHQVAAISHHIWKLHFEPIDVCTFKEDLLLVTDMNNITVFVYKEQGQQIHSINMQAENIHRLYSVLGTSKGLVVADLSDNRSSVLWVNQRGSVLRRYTGHGRDGIRDPYGLVEDKEKNIIIADHTNNRIHLLNRDGQLQHYLLQADEGAVKPRRLYLDHSTETPRLFIGCGEPGDVQVRIYDYKALCSARPSLRSVFEDDCDAETRLGPDQVKFENIMEPDD